MANFDQIMPMNSSGNEVGGYIPALNEEFYIHLTVQETESPRKIRLRGCKKSQEILQPVLTALEQHLCQCNTIKDMLSEIQNALEQQIRIRGVNQYNDLHLEFNTLLEQLQMCGWDKVQYISPDFQSIQLKAVDDFNRDHILKIWIPDKFPSEAPKYECDLPQEFSYKWLPGDTLLTVFEAFQENLARFSEFWNIMDEIDEQTWVLEPENPRRKDCKRRLALFIMPLREKFNKNIHLWSEYESVLNNLRQVLEMEFPSPSSTEKEEFCMECGICYSYHLGEAVPDVTCENPKCNQPFHLTCLYEYIRMLPDVKSAFNKLFGECPYCSKALWCTIP